MRNEVMRTVSALHCRRKRGSLSASEKHQLWQLRLRHREELFFGKVALAVVLGQDKRVHRARQILRETVEAGSLPQPLHLRHQPGVVHGNLMQEHCDTVATARVTAVHI